MGAVTDLIGGIVSGIGDTAVKLRTAITGVDATKQAELTQIAMQLEQQAAQAQADIDKVEAASSNVFVAGWRPFIGWCCGAVMAYNYIIAPLIVLIPGVPRLPTLDFGEISPILFGMLGLGTMRTVEKIKGAQGNH